MSQLSFIKATRHAWRPVAALVGVLLLLPACTTEEIIFVERPFFDDPPAGAAGYMGYVTSDPGDQNRTVCGECHNTKANAWKSRRQSSSFHMLSVRVFQSSSRARSVFMPRSNWRRTVFSK